MASCRPVSERLLAPGNGGSPIAALGEFRSQGRSRSARRCTPTAVAGTSAAPVASRAVGGRRVTISLVRQRPRLTAWPAARAGPFPSSGLTSAAGLARAGLRSYC